MREVFLSFDVEGPPFSEDYMSHRSLKSLLIVLRLLEKYDLRGLFFVTGSVVDRISQEPEVVELMSQHEVGYHSSSHSVRPMIFEYTDISDYDQAVQVSLEREASRIETSTGKILGKGGIVSLAEVFPNNRIESFRAPFLCWTPPHLEALRKHGIRFDFSSCLSQGPWYRPVRYKGITFYSPPIPIDSRINAIMYLDTFPKKAFLPNLLLPDMLSRESTVLMEHPASLVYHTPREYRPEKSSCILNSFQNEPRSQMNMTSLILTTEFLFMQLSLLKKAGLIDITPHPRVSDVEVDPKNVSCKTVYDMSMWAPLQLFRFEPKFLYSHFERFFSGAHY
jgi:hypothetical protein